MAYQATSWAKGVRTGHPTRKAVLMIMAERADDHRYVWCGHNLIRDEAEVSIRTSQRVVHQLHLIGLIQIWQARDKGGQTHNLYRLSADYESAEPMRWDHPARNPNYKLLDGWGSQPQRRDNLSPGPGDTHDAPGDTHDAPGDTHDAPGDTHDANRVTPMTHRVTPMTEPGDTGVALTSQLTSQEQVRATNAPTPVASDGAPVAEPVKVSAMTWDELTAIPAGRRSGAVQAEIESRQADDRQRVIEEHGSWEAYVSSLASAP